MHKKTISTRVICSRSGKCIRLGVHKTDVMKLKLCHLQTLKVYFPKKYVAFNSKITASSSRTHWRINVPLQKAREAMLHPRSDVDIILAI